MILQELNGYYQRMLADPEAEVPEFGFGMQGVHFCLTIDGRGNLVGDPLDLRREGRPMRAEVPGPVKKTSGVSSNFAWENTGYALGADGKGKPKRTAQTHQAFKALAAKVLGDVDDDGATALLAFLDGWSSARVEDLAGWDDLIGLNVVFRLDGERRFIHQRPALRQAWLGHLAENESEIRGMCLVSGESGAPISLVHAAIKGVPGAQTSGAALVSFNIDSAVSFGKKQNQNAPVSERSAFAYTTALNHLLAPNSKRKVQVGDTTVLFWTGAPDPGRAEGFFGLALGGRQAEDEVLAKALGDCIEAVAQGKYPGELGDPGTPFQVLGLSPNAARLSVRFWHTGTVGGMVENVGRHFRDMHLKCQPNFGSDPKYPSPWWLLKELAPQQDSRNMSPLLAGQLISSIVGSRPYPRTLLTAAIGRIRADKRINHLRACIIKAYLVRNEKQEIAMALDKDNKDIGYRLGRLFAIVERIQEEAVPGANATVRDRFFSAASATPGRAFPVILKNAQNGLAKIRKENPGRAVNMDKAIQEILAGVDPGQGLPPTLNLKRQGMFMLGYYQQRQDLFTKKQDKTEE